jgi:hypothetical protein
MALTVLAQQYHQMRPLSNRQREYADSINFIIGKSAYLSMVDQLLDQLVDQLLDFQ